MARKAVQVAGNPKWPASNIEWRQTRDLLAYQRNSRIHSDAQVDQIAASMKEFGWTIPMLIDDDGIIIAGHGRALAAAKIGISEVPVMIAKGWTEAQKMAYRIADNRLPESASWDTDMLKLELTELGKMDFDLSLTGFDDLELVQFMATPNVNDPEETPELPVNPISQIEDLWILGGHRIFCGDGTSSDQLELAIGKARIGCVITDPPYGVSVVKHGMVGANFGIAKKGRYAPVIGDQNAMSVGYLLDLASTSIIWGGNYFADQLPPSGSWLVWDKRSDSGIENTFADCELAWSNIGSAARVHRQLWNGMIREGEHTKREHPTQKPIDLFRWCISKTKGTILDPFLGAGTTLISAEISKRPAIGIEIDPAYVDVAVQRWQTYTGQEATLEATGETYAEVADKRLNAPAKPARKRKAAV